MKKKQAIRILILISIPLAFCMVGNWMMPFVSTAIKLTWTGLILFPLLFGIALYWDLK